MKLSKIIYWIIIGMLCYLPLYFFVYCFFLLFYWSDNHSGFLQAILIAVGFIFVYRQIKIEKNKDIFFNFQKNLESELNFYLKKNYNFFTEYEKLNRSMYNKSDTNYYKYLQDNYLDILNKYENIFYSRLMTLDKWWLGENCTEFEKLINSKEYKNIINFTRHLYKNQMCFLVENEDKESKKHIKINELIRNERKEYQKLVEIKNKLEPKITEFLEKLAKAKGVL